MALQLDPGNPQPIPNTNQRRTLYDAGYGEVFWKSFLAGLGQGLGRVIVSIFFYLFLTWIFVTYALPQVMAMLGPVTQLIPLLQQSQTGAPTSGTPKSGSTPLQLPDQVQNLFK